MDWAKSISNIVLQVTLIIIFISVFFLTYTTTIEKNIVTMETDYLIKNMSDDFNTVFTADEMSIMKSLISDIKHPDMTEADASVKQSNDVLIKQSINIMTYVAVIGFITTILIVVYYKVDVKQLFKQVFFGLLTVMAVEFIFLTYIAQNYISLDPNSVKLNIVQNLQNYMSN